MHRPSPASPASRSICRRALGVLIAPISSVTGAGRGPPSLPGRVPPVMISPNGLVSTSAGVRGWPVSAPAPFPECPGARVRPAGAAVSGGPGRRHRPGQQLPEADLDVTGAHPGDRRLELGQDLPLPGGVTSAGLGRPAVRLRGFTARHGSTLPAVAPHLHPACAENVCASWNCVTAERPPIRPGDVTARWPYRPAGQPAARVSKSKSRPRPRCPSSACGPGVQVPPAARVSKSACGRVAPAARVSKFAAPGVQARPGVQVPPAARVSKSRPRPGPGAR